MRDFGQSNSEAVQYWKDSLEYISDALCELDNKKTWYRISSAFFNYTMRFAKDQNKNIDGMMYPSANTQGAGLNVVLKKESDITLYIKFTFRSFYKTLNTFIS